MMVFFTTIGLGASFKLFKIGGKILYFTCMSLYCCCSGSMSMEGGHGNAAAYGKTLEESFNIDSTITLHLA